jgi:predicted RNA-binding protein with PIN domain
MNVIGTRPDRWCRDRAAARRRLVVELATLVGPGTEVTVVFDGRSQGTEQEEAEAAGVAALFAPGGPNAGDHAIVSLVRSAEDPGAITVVTSDAALADAVRDAGASVQGSGAFLAGLRAP